MTGNNPEVHVFHTVGWYSVVHSFNSESVQKASSIELIMSSKPFYMAAVHQNSHCKLEYIIILMFLCHQGKCSMHHMDVTCGGSHTGYEVHVWYVQITKALKVSCINIYNMTSVWDKQVVHQPSMEQSDWSISDNHTNSVYCLHT